MIDRPRAPGSDGGGRSVRLPHGVRDYLPEAAARRRGIAEAVLGEVERWGYRRIITPAFEYESVLARGLGPGVQAQAVRFVEPGTGEVVLLRPDITPQVARLVATRFPQADGPLRLSYEGAVVRLQRGGPRELFQAGVELLDAGAPAGDVEVIELAAAALEAAGVRDFVLDLGCAPLARAALSGLPEAMGEEVRAAVARKDQAEVARLAGAIDGPAWQRALLAALPGLYGGPEVIDHAAALLVGSGQAEAGAGLAALGVVIARLRAAGLDGRITVDLGEVRGFDYYTGVRFSGYAPGVGDALLSGGRYDHLIERYGRAGAAAGFAVDVERVAMALSAAAEAVEPGGVGIYLAGEQTGRATLARALRTAGARVVEHLEDADGAGAPLPDDGLAARAQAAGVQRVLVLQGAGARWFDLPGPAAPSGRGGGLAGPLAGTLDQEGVAALVAGTEPLDAILPARYPAPASRVAPPGSAARRG